MIYPSKIQNFVLKTTIGQTSEYSLLQYLHCDNQILYSVFCCCTLAAANADALNIIIFQFSSEAVVMGDCWNIPRHSFSILLYMVDYMPLFNREKPKKEILN